MSTEAQPNLTSDPLAPISERGVYGTGSNTGTTDSKIDPRHEILSRIRQHLESGRSHSSFPMDQIPADMKILMEVSTPTPQGSPLPGVVLQQFALEHNRPIRPTMLVQQTGSDQRGISNFEINDQGIPWSKSSNATTERLLTGLVTERQERQTGYFLRCWYKGSKDDGYFYWNRCYVPVRPVSLFYLDNKPTPFPHAAVLAGFFGTTAMTGVGGGVGATAFQAQHNLTRACIMFAFAGIGLFILLLLLYKLRKYRKAAISYGNKEPKRADDLTKAVLLTIIAGLSCAAVAVVEYANLMNATFFPFIIPVVIPATLALLSLLYSPLYLPKPQSKEETKEEASSTARLPSLWTSMFIAMLGISGAGAGSKETVFFKPGLYNSLASAGLGIGVAVILLGIIKLGMNKYGNPNNSAEAAQSPQGPLGQPATS